MSPVILPDLRAVQIRRKRIAAVVLSGVLALVLVAGPVWPRDGWARHLVEETGLLLIGLAIIGRAWCSLYIGGRKKDELVQVGPYAMSRNPLYLFSFIGCAGVGAQTGSLTLSLIFLLAAVAVFLPVITQEERYLVGAFGESFERYVARTPRLLPDFRLWSSPTDLSIKPALFVRTLLDGLPFLLAWPLFDAIGRWHDSLWEPLMRLP